MLLVWFYALILLGRIAVITGQGQTPVLHAVGCRNDFLRIECTDRYPHQVIQVIDVYLAGDYNPYSCNTHTDACRGRTESGPFYETVMDRCHNHEVCSIETLWPDKYIVCGRWWYYLDYCLVKYRCIYNSASSTGESTAVPFTTSWTRTLNTTKEVTRQDNSIPSSTLPNNRNSTDENQVSIRGSPSTGLIVGVTLGIVLLVIIILVVVFLLWRKRKASSSGPSTAPAHSNQIYDGSVASSVDNMMSPVGVQPGNSKCESVSKPITDSDYSLATAVDEYAKADKRRPRKQSGDYSSSHGTRIDDGIGDYSLATGDLLGNAPGGTGYPGYGNTDRNPQYRATEYGMIDGPQQQMAVHRDLDDNDLVVEDNANYEGGQFPTRGPIHGNPDTLLSHDDDLVITDNAHYETGQFQDRDPRDEVGNEDVSHSDVVMIDNANYEKSNFSTKSGPQPADRKVDISVTDEALDHSRPEEADDTDVTIIDNADYVGYEGV